MSTEKAEALLDKGYAVDELVADFIAETSEGLEALDNDLVRLEQQPNDGDLLGRIFRLIHTIKGNCGFLGLGRLQSVAHAAENVLGAFRQGELPIEPDSISAILDAIGAIRSITAHLAAEGVEPAGDDLATIARLDLIFEKAAPTAAAATAAMTRDAELENETLMVRLGGRPGIDSACRLAIESLSGDVFGGDRNLLQRALCEGLCSAARGSETAEEFSIRLHAVAGEPGAKAPIEPLLAAIVRVFATLGASLKSVEELLAPLRDPDQHATAAPAAPAAPLAAAPSIAPPVAGEAEAAGPQTIRVNVEVLEHLMTVASELVLVRNQLLQTLRVDPESPFAGPLHRLNQVTSELQESVMTTRMQPVGGAWAKLPRLVRDLARDLGKKIELTMSGEETELDRQVMELIKDPLTHMIRNAADHGLETPEQRIAAGKPEQGRIALAARHEGGAIVIEVSDDGRGLSPSKIRAKAVSSGLVNQTQADAMSDTEAQQLIFGAGFSTAAEVTAVSGRGVGMDVVRSNVEKIGGAIELSSTEGVGSQFTIRIPLTLAIISALIVECCGERFAMPQSSVVELVSANDAAPHKIEYIEGAAVLRLRDRLLPLLFLHKLLDLDEALVVPGETCIVAARIGGFTFGVVVDRVFDTEEIVVKPMATVLRHLKLYAGATILGDGGVIPILDFKGISVEAGVGPGANRARDEAAGWAVEVKRTAVLVYRTESGALKGAPLEQVARIEEIEPRQIEHVDGRAVVQYRGKLMPILSADAGAAVAWTGDEARPLLVFSRGDRSLGLLAREIVDIVECATDVELAASGAGAAGSLIIAGAATELIDVDYYWRSLGLADQPEATQAGPTTVAVAPSPSAGARRLLLIDESPFSQLLLSPLLGQAGYQVTVATDAAAALALHNGGETFQLIMADITAKGDAARKLAATLAAATSWHNTPVLGLGLSTAGANLGPVEQAGVLEAISQSMGAERAVA